MLTGMALREAAPVEQTFEGPLDRQRGKRRTKIVATIGPACDSPDALRALAAAGMDVARVTLAHGTTAEALGRVRLLREVVPHVSILVDLPGPKIRAVPFPEGGVTFVPGAEVLLVADRDTTVSSATRIGVSYPPLVEGLQPGDPVALGDGGVSLVVKGRTREGAIAGVRSGGSVQGRPGVTAPAARFALITPTPEDLERVDVLVDENVDAIAVSFVLSANDIVTVRQAAERRARRDPTLAVPMLVAKIETAEAVADLDAIVAASDAVMVARGDLGVRMDLEDVPHIQKRIIHTAVRYGRPVITATQMLESMVSASVPTRAEVTDVANAVLDGTSAVMLSAETAVGADPARVVATMARVATRAEREFQYLEWGTNLGAQEIAGDAFSPERVTAATTAAGWRAAFEEDAAALIACTRSGTTARAISRFRPHMPIVAATPSVRTARQLALSWGVNTLVVRESTSTDEIVWFAVQATVRAGYASPGDVVVVLAGSPVETEPATDTMRLVRIR
jgi:pyruvate kinase